jgi:tetratricopeptide (TPR) repeat protein
VKSTYYDQATVAYGLDDYPQALKGYYQCLKEDWGTFRPGDAGLVYHRIGNCLIKMRNFKEAAVSYQKALQDDDYTEKTSIYVNLGTTLNGVGKYAEAITYFNKALSDAAYVTPYRAHMGLGTAYTKLGKYVEAGTAYRDAALDEGNPNPVKALMSLASTFMTLERPDDAVEAYLAILDFRVVGKTLNTTLDRLGQAYVVAGRYQEGLDTFEDVLSRDQFTLSPEATESRQQARGALGLISESTPESAAAVATAGAVPQEGDPFAGFDLQSQSPLDASAPYPALEFNEEEGYGAGNVPHPGDTGFFTATDADLIATSKREMRKERKLRHTGLWVVAIILVILIAAFGACVAAYYQGVGFPSQEQVVTEFFEAHSANESVESYWVTAADADATTLKRLLDGVARTSDVSIVSIDSQMMESQVLADAKLPEGGVIHYRVDLVRDIIGWKINGIEMVFASTT